LLLYEQISATSLHVDDAYPIKPYVQSRIPSKVNMVSFSEGDREWAWNLEELENRGTSFSLCSENLNCKGQTGTKSQSIFIQNFNFSIPEDAIIYRIQVNVDRKSSEPQRIQDEIIQLLLKNKSIGVNYSSTTFWSEYWETISYPEEDVEDQLWEHSWCPFEINGEDFGVEFGISFAQISESDHLSNIVDAFLRCVRIEVYYYFICQELYNCSYHGVCTPVGTCLCNDGYTLEDCSQVYCTFGCSGHGNCTGPQICLCDPHYDGQKCEILRKTSPYQNSGGTVVVGGLIGMVSLASMIFGFAISMTYFLAKQKYQKREGVEKIEIEPHREKELELEPVVPATYKTTVIHDWKKVSNSKEWFL